MSESNTLETIDMKSPNHCRPADHPVHLDWAPAIPWNYYAITQQYVKPSETSKEAFHADWAVEAFGENYMKRLALHQGVSGGKFRGDWFLFAFLLRCHETEKDKRGIYPDFFEHYLICGCPFCQHGDDAPFGTDIHLENANLSYLDLEYAQLGYAHLDLARLENTCLLNANLKHATLRYANLKNATLQKADLKNANLEGANLTNANLRCADLTNANLSNAILDGADVRGATGIVFNSIHVKRLLND